jgi:hypothetical protein
MLDNPRRATESEERCSHFGKRVKRDVAFRKVDEVTCLFRRNLTALANPHQYVQMRLLTLLSMHELTAFL